MGTRSASHSTLKKFLCAYRQCSTHSAKSSGSEIFELSDNSKFSISPEKVITSQN